MRNIDPPTVNSFGNEWERFDQSGLTSTERAALFDTYFTLFPWNALRPNAVGFDAGCGSGRWALHVAPRVGHLHCVDASDRALDVARRALRSIPNTTFHLAPLDHLPLEDAAMDFGYALGVLHHLPDPLAGLLGCVRKLKPGAPMLIYVYYDLSDRPGWFRRVWRFTDRLRRRISTMSQSTKERVTTVIAAAIYWPLARVSFLLDAAGLNVDNVPLSFYRRLSFYTMRTDALDRFGTPLESRFSRADVEQLMTDAGLRGIEIADDPPYWRAIGYRGSRDL